MTSNMKKVLQRYRDAEIKVEPPRDRPEEPEYPFQGKLTFQDIVIDIENVKGSTRSGTDDDGKEWSIQMKAHYGEIRASEGTDGDKLDVYVGDDEFSRWVFVIHQVRPGDHEDAYEFDEDKVMLGFTTANQAIDTYQAHYNRNDFFGGMTMIPMSKFKAWLAHPDTDGTPVQPPVQWKHEDMGPDEPPRTASASGWDPNTFHALAEEGQALAQEFDKKSRGMRSLSDEDWKRRSR